MSNKFKDILSRNEVLKRLNDWRAQASKWAECPASMTVVFTSVAVILGLIISLAFRTGVEKYKLLVPGAESPRPSEAAKVAVLENLDWADVQSVAGLEPQIAAIKQFFKSARSRTFQYSETVLGWESKWKLASDYVTGRTEHTEFLQSEFERSLFSRHELDQLIEQTVIAFMRNAEDIESQMLVRMKADLDRLPADALPTFVDETSLNMALNDALHQAADASKVEMGMAIGREIVSYIAGETLALVATNLATSAGILTAGASSSWATFGAGIVIGIAADAIVTEVYQQQFDPIGNLTSVINAQLDAMEHLILDGTNESPGLESRLKRYAHNRNTARRQAFEKNLLAI